MFMRTYLMGGCINTRGMQHIGFSYVMEPGLRFLYPVEDDLQKARKRYLRFVNTHPCWVPFLIGLFFSIERKIHKGLIPPKSLLKMKGTLACTLSAVGDSLFGGSIYVFWSLSTMLFLSQGLHGLAWAWALGWIILLEGFKAYTFWQGMTQGLPFLARVKSWNLMGWAGRIKVVNACLLVLFWGSIWPDPSHLACWVAGSCGMLFVGWLASFSCRIREVMLLILFVLFVVIPWVWPYLTRPYAG